MTTTQTRDASHDESGSNMRKGLMPKAPKKIHLSVEFIHQSTRFNGPICANKGNSPILTIYSADVTCTNCVYAVRAITGDYTYIPFPIT